MLRIARASLMLLVLLGCGPAARAQDQSAKLAYFENQIRPLLSKHCFECHNDKKQEGGLRLDFRQAMLDGGESGPALVAGKPEESVIIEAVRYEGYEMPPTGRLPDEEIAKLVRWVREGAHWPETDTGAKPSLGDQEAIRKTADSHWAFAAINPPQLPETSDPDWARHPVDRLVLAKLEANGLKPSPAARRPTLIRRAFNDLIGLPPTPEIIESIFGSRSLRGKTFRDIVDGLLESDHYGERMARHWMDVARYADTRDFLAAADLRYPFAFTYRDWLISAFNQDMPYDDFVRQQLGADYLAERDDDPNLAALGFLTVGPLFRNNMLERVADRVDVVTRGLMGLTGSCARCHDHKYDPISIEDYYALYGVFRDSVRPNEFPTIQNPLGTEVPDDLSRGFQKALDKEKQKLREYESGLADSAAKSFAERPTEYLLGYVEMNIEKSETTRGLKSKRNLEECALTPIAKHLDAFRRDKSNSSHRILGPLTSLIAVADDTYDQRKQSYLSRYGEQLHPIIRRAVETSQSRKNLAEQLGAAFRESAENQDESAKEIRDMVVDPIDGPFVISAAEASSASRLLGKGRQALLKFQQAIADVEATHPGSPHKAMIVKDAKTLPPVFVMYRGEANRRGPQVDRRFPEYFAGSSDNRFRQGSGRLELAEKIVALDNPLAARVIVNRVWRMHFGYGLVADAGDFGLRSDPPAQQELMDWLAWSLRQHDWSLKWLHRTIMMTNTYRQSSTATNPPMRNDGTSAAEIDSTNQLLWRQNRRRLDFESMRDCVLATAGTLDTRIGGRSVPLSQTPHPTRRTVYAYVDRVDPDPLFATFDVPSASVSSAQRTETLVPQQALFAMNNLFVTDQARAMVKRTDFQRADTTEDRVNVLMRRVLQREARANEIAMVARFVDSAKRLSGRSQPIWQYGYGPADGTVESFRSLHHFAGNRYTFEREFPSPKVGFAQHTRSGGHPGKHSGLSSIRRWVSPGDMTIRIAGLLQRPSDRGDGIRAIIKINGRPIYQEVITTGSTKTVCDSLTIEKGDVIDFVVDPIKTSTSDGYRWTVSVEQRDETNKNARQRWHSAEDFAGPPPPPMTAWEQAAQALLMTNEFLFVD